MRSLLEVGDLQSYYGRAQVLHGVSLSVAAGEVLMMLGRNGAGKSTTMKSIIGLLPPAAGRVHFAGHDVARREPYQIARLGLGYVPEERRIFADLTVAENIEAGRRPPRQGLRPWTQQRLLELFPSLARLLDQPAGRLSGGEQQMLTVARTLMGNPRMILLDEPSEGLAPLVVQQMAVVISNLKQEGLGILLAEQNLRLSATVADRATVIERGKTVWEGTVQGLQDHHALRTQYFGI